MAGGASWQPLPAAPQPNVPFWVWDGAAVSLATFSPAHSVITGTFTIDDATGAVSPSGIADTAHEAASWRVVGSRVPVVPLLMQGGQQAQPDRPQTVAFAITLTNRINYDKVTGVTENVQLYVGGAGRATQDAVADGPGYFFGGVGVPPAGTTIELKGVTSGLTSTITV